MATMRVCPIEHRRLLSVFWSLFIRCSARPGSLPRRRLSQDSPAGSRTRLLTRERLPATFTRFEPPASPCPVGTGLIPSLELPAGRYRGASTSARLVTHEHGTRFCSRARRVIRCASFLTHRLYVREPVPSEA